MTSMALTAVLVTVIASADARADVPVIPKVAAGPTVDGDLSDAVWKEAAVFTLHHADADQKGEPANPTTVRVLTDAATIYFGFDCVETHPDGPFAPKTAARKNEKRIPDHVRVQWSHGRRGKAQFFTFRASPARDFVSRIIYKPVAYTTYSCHDCYRGGSSVTLPSYRSESTVLKGRWTAEIAVALKELALYEADGIPDLAEVNFFRIRAGDDRDTFDTMIVWDEGPVAWRGFWSHLQAWKRMPTPSRFSADHGGNTWFAIQPLWFGLVKLEVGTLTCNLVSNPNIFPPGFTSTRRHYTCWGYTEEERRRRRIEWWEDTVPERPAWKAGLTVPTNVPVATGRRAAFAGKPTVTRAGDAVRIAFAVTEPVDVAVGIVDKAGRIIRHLAAGVLGDNPPAPLKANALEQALTWDRTDDHGKPVPAGRYTVRVSLGLAPTFTYVFKDAKGAPYDAGGSQIAERVGIGTLTPVRWDLHPHGGFAMQICANRVNEEVVLNGHAVYDGKTGRYLREVQLADFPRFPARNARGELGVGPMGNWWVTVFNDLRRYRPDGAPVPFEALGSHVIPQVLRGQANPNRGFSFGGPAQDGYVVQHYDTRRNWRGVVTRIGTDGRVRQWGLVECQFPIAGVKVDRAGAVYVGCTARPKDRLIPPDFRRSITDEIRAFYAPFYGSVVKFKPTGGSVFPAADGNLVATYNSYAYGKRLTLRRAKVVGADWLRPGFSTITVRAGPNHCNCASGRFDLDPFERLWIPDAIRSRIDVVDSNGNTILVVGRHGAPADSEGTNIRFGYPKMVAVTDLGCYVMDFFHRRAVKLDLHYRAQAEVPFDL